MEAFRGKKVQDLTLQDITLFIDRVDTLEKADVAIEWLVTVGMTRPALPFSKALPVCLFVLEAIRLNLRDKKYGTRFYDIYSKGGKQ